MRVAIVGTCDAAIALRGLVQRDDHLVLDDGRQADFVLHLEEGAVPNPTIDGIDGPVELKIHAQIGLHSPSKRVTTLFGGGHKATDRDIRIIVPAKNAAESHAIERGVYQGLLKVATADGTPAAKGKKWLGMFVLAAALLVPSIAAAQAGAVSVRDSTSGALVPNIGNDTNDAIRVYCVAGTCSGGGGGGGTSIADRATFTFGTDNLTPIGGVFDDTPPAVLTTGMAGAARLTAYRALHVNLRDTSGNVLAWPSALGQTTMANSWPVVIASNQSGVPVTGTFWQATQPVSNAGTFAVQCTSGCGGSSFLDNAAFTFGTTPVSPMGAVVDDTSPNAVTENSAGTPRMSTRRELYSQIRDAAGNERGANVTADNALKVDGSAVTQPVSGTVTITDGAGAVNVIVDSGTITASDPTFTDATGTTVPANAAVVAGTDGTTTRAIKTDASGELQVDVLTLPSVTIGTFPDNEPFNLAQYNGSAVGASNPIFVKDQRAATPTVTSVNDQATSTTCLASNANRLGAVIANDSSADLYVKFGATASTTSYTYKLYTDQALTVPFGYTGVIDCIWSADSTGAARVTEVAQ